jgi:hypothetical protein
MKRILALVAGLLLSTSCAFAEINVRNAPYSAVGDCNADDTTAINNAIADAIANGGDSIYFPSTKFVDPAHPGCYRITNTLLINRLGKARYDGTIHLRGDGLSKSEIFLQAAALSAIKYTGDNANNGLESDLKIEGLRILGSNSGRGIEVIGAAYVTISDVAVEGFEYGYDGTNNDQTWFYSSQFQWNGNGIRFNTPGSPGITAANTINLYSTTIANNVLTGLTMDGANEFAMYGGGIYYNGTIDCTTNATTTCWGAKFINAGDGNYGGGPGTILFSGTSFEGNGGQADLWSVQTNSGSQIHMTIENTAFNRTNAGGSKGYAQNQIRIDGTSTLSNYNIVNSNFWGYGSYVANAGRPMIVNNNTNAILSIDGHTKFGHVSGSTIERPSIAVLSSPFSFRVSLGSNQNLAYNTVTKVNFDTVDFDGLTGWDATNHVYKPNVPGTYLVSFSWIVNADYILSPDAMIAWVAKNGTIGSTGSSQGVWIAPSDSAGVQEKLSMTGTTLVQMNGLTDTLEIDARVLATSAHLIGGTTLGCFMAVSRVGP